MQKIQNANLVSVIQEINLNTELETTDPKKLIQVLLILCAIKPEKMFKKVALNLVSVYLPNISMNRVDVFKARCFTYF